MMKPKCPGLVKEENNGGFLAKLTSMFKASEKKTQFLELFL
jgi:hypothetical protein